MGISSLGVGSSILTQDVLDQLREADEAGRIRPITLNIANEEDKRDALKVIDATMTNFIDSINAVKNASLWDDRNAEVTSGASVEVSAINKTDVQDFTLDVTALATKQIEQSGAFSSASEVVDASAGTFTLQVGSGNIISIDYEAGATLKDIKSLINKEAGEEVSATIVQIDSGEFRLFINSDETGSSKDIQMSSASGLDSRLTTDFDLAAIKSGTNAEFTFNGQAISRESNEVKDLITGLTINIKSTGSSDVSISQDRTSILEKFDSFVSKYNSAITELNKMTKPSVESSEKGIFSGDSTIKSMKRTIQDMVESIGGGVGSMIDYGFSIDKDGKMSLDTTVLEDKMNDKPANLQAFFSGGDFTKDNGTVTVVEGAFTQMSAVIEDYTKTNRTLDQIKNAIGENIKTYEERKENATKRLDARYEIMKRQFASYDLLISKINSASSMFVQMAEAQSAAQNR